MEPSPSSPPVKDAPKTSGGSGCLKIFVLVITLFGAAIFATLNGVQYYSLNSKNPSPTPPVVKDDVVVKAAGPYEYKGHSISLTMDIPLQGGAVTGVVTGECNGKVNGTYDGKDQGVISGTITGYCNLAIVPVPAKATFQGMVNKESKSVPISFDGSAAGFTHTGSLTLSY